MQYPRSPPGAVAAVQSSRFARQRAGAARRAQAGSEQPMKALVKIAAEAGLRLEDVPVPAIGRDDVLIRVLRTGVCGTDLHIYEWDGWAQANVPVPLVVGHEFAGEIVEMGSDVRDLAVGDLVSGEGHLVCGRCRNCMAGRRVQCAHVKGVGVNHPGAFAEYIALPAGNVWRHLPGIDLDVAAIFDPFGNAVHSALTFPVHGEDVLITGAGPIGIMAAIVAGHAGARHVVITDVSPYRLELAGKIGVTVAADTRERPLAQIMADLGMPRPAGRRVPDRLGAPRTQHDHDQGHLRPGDVRDLVLDVRADPVWRRHRACHHAPLRRS